MSMAMRENKGLFGSVSNTQRETYYQWTAFFSKLKGKDKIYNYVDKYHKELLPEPEKYKFIKENQKRLKAAEIKQMTWGQMWNEED